MTDGVVRGPLVLLDQGDRGVGLRVEVDDQDPLAELGNQALRGAGRWS